MSDPAQIWDQARLAIQLLAVDPVGLGGIALRARSGPVRDALVDQLGDLPLPSRKIAPNIGDEQLFGGVDIAATLSAGHVVRTRGLLQTPSTILLTMAERCDSALAARLAQHLDTASAGCLVLLDEGAEPDEAAPAALTERLAFHIDLDGVPASVIGVPAPMLAADPGRPVDNAAATLVALATRFGIDSLRAPLLALRTARAHAQLAGRDWIGDTDIAVAAGLVYPARATRLPEPEDLPPEDQLSEPNASPDDPPDTGEDRTDQSLPDGDMLVEAVRAMLPAGLLDTLRAGAMPRSAPGGNGAGARRKGNRRGRPLPARPGRLDGKARLDLVATLRAAAPWQPLRRASQPDAPGLLIRASDLRVRRFEEKSDRLLIFTVDASGSAAVSRLSEAKGAVELLLGEAYARRDHVSLIAFRGEQAELLLPPTRSLVQTKRRLADLPGGGATPLAAGLREAASQAQLCRSKGLSPTVVVLTDGRANITLDGTADRPRAAEDAEKLARQLRAMDVPGLVIDMSNRPQPGLRSLAANFDVPYLPLPRADAHRLTGAVNAALDAQ